jgi:UDP-N-acetylglucosamine--N-acetylmuramyl-(pentapeptide) pyrophosphoryl-undecaprenol N-acetylglucosamine transferase
MVQLSKKIILTGGGTAGHVTPNIALLPRLKENDYIIEYIGTADGIEKKLIENQNIKYHVITSGKFRRYFDVRNFTDPFKVIKGIWQASDIIRKEKPDLIFSKGGFVSVPVVIGAFLNKVPIIIHESDMTPGLANKISIPYCSKVCVTFPETLKHIKKNKVVLTGSPIREELLNGSRILGAKLCNFEDKKTVLLIIGGSLGSKAINETVRRNIDILLKSYNIIHICGKKNVDTTLINKKNYAQFEYVNAELPDLFAYSDIIISRAGANVIFELLALKKPNLLIPLSAKSSRGDQILNAKSFEKNGFSVVIQEENLKEGLLLERLDYLNKNRNVFIKNMDSTTLNNSISIIIDLIKKYTK